MGSSIFLLLLLYLALVVFIDTVTPQSLRLDVFAAVAPMTAAALCTYRQTIFLGTLDFVIMATTHALLPASNSPVNRVAAVLGNALMVGASIAVAKLRADREDLLERIRDTGEAAQRALLRKLPLRTRHLLVDGFYVSAQRDALVGGDIYDAVDTPHGARVLIGDVRGKGLGTLGAGAAVLTAFREAAFHRSSLESGVQAMEQGLWRYNASAAESGGESEAGEAAAGPEESGSEERFVTALVFGTNSGTDTGTGSDGAGDWSAPGDTADDGTAGGVPMVFIGCGHVAPFLIGADGTVCELEPADPGLPLGLGELSGQPRTAQHVVLPPDARLFTCTDGVTEARDADGVFYPLADRLTDWAALPTPELLQRLQADLDAYTGGQLADDVAVLVIGQADA
ncbi:PP2C family protein-serine/threonine phosphatase [Streptomyces sp. H27-D2]|uniref:PP2C family protein-serine/threonine phosphatase n=1 Tax=Streptomyces sp. H27-D2 TaxID=3046304 RepID=UPI002DB72B8A|nr:PP2C family protein-serine/threonine phosphatase [Streptomyces sp. H27-D2]MEC4019124.1 PP2C family protein-serine/threonine phosphatase [Streptomyces sp. H27-D2]